MEPKPEKTSSNFYQFNPLPSEEELAKFYSEKYFQMEGRGGYLKSYEPEELEWRKARLDLVIRPALSHMADAYGDSEKKFLDIGCGEGWVMQFMHNLNWNVQGIDFSNDAISRCCPDMLPFFRQGNFYTILEENNTEKYDLIHLGNVIEHVREPERLLKLILESLSRKGILVMTAPNDFTPLQDYLLKHKFVDKQYFLAYPDHLSYFNKHSMTALLSSLGYAIIDLLCDFPMEFNLFAEHTNYVMDKSIGKKAHWQRIRIENWLFQQDPQILIDLYRVMANHGLGRNIIYYCRKAE